jgi:signal recognition particle subunit SRP19
MAAAAVGVDVSKWAVVYPVYLNNKKKVSEGRRLPKSKAVDNPTLQEIVNVGKALGLELVPEVRRTAMIIYFR